jgi:septum formation protein
VLRDAGFRPEVMVSGVSEDVDAPDASTMVALLAVRKGTAVADQCPDALVMACDSMLDLDGRTFGKPRSPAEAIAYWRTLSGRTAYLHTGHWIMDTRSGRSLTDTASTAVRFATPSEAEIKAYVATGEPFKAAGGFTLEGFGAPFVEGIEGDATNVLGLSLPLFRLMLGRLDVDFTDLWCQGGDGDPNEREITSA